MKHSKLVFFFWRAVGFGAFKLKPLKSHCKKRVLIYRNSTFVANSIFSFSCQNTIKNIPNFIPFRRRRTVNTATMSRRETTTQCHICLDHKKPSNFSNLLTESTKTKFNIRNWMMVCTDCVINVIMQDSIKKNNLLNNAPFVPASSIDKHSIFF